MLAANLLAPSGAQENPKWGGSAARNEVPPARSGPPADQKTTHRSKLDPSPYVWPFFFLLGYAVCVFQETLIASSAERRASALEGERQQEK